MHWRVPVFVLLCCVLAQPLLAKQKKHAPKPAPVKQEAPPPPQPPPVPVELTLAQKPAVPPQVTFQNGQLTIVAENSTIGDVLRAVRNKTGASVEMPPNATQRIVSHVGPGSARDVLASFLNGCDFNYVLLGAAGDSGAVQKIIVTPKPAGSGAVMQANAQGAVPQPATPLPPEAYDQGGSAIPAEVDNSADGDTDTANEDGQPAPPASQPEGQPGVKTPEQMLQELQQQQQLLQQQQQQQQQEGQPPRN